MQYATYKNSQSVINFIYMKY